MENEVLRVTCYVLRVTCVICSRTPVTASVLSTDSIDFIVIIGYYELGGLSRTWMRKVS